jgi:uncharacterized membrane protein YeaQ/YmgE (transglycosylase-associated protein family)
MNFTLWLVVGAFVGWAASKVMNNDDQQGLVLNVVVGILGALIGGSVLSPIAGASTINEGDFSFGGLFVSLVGAITLLVIVNSLAQRQVR